MSDRGGKVVATGCHSGIGATLDVDGGFHGAALSDKVDLARMLEPELEPA
ncbi:hypothetical protein [Sphingomonas bacterium]|nr:hypothetical protein [Sphingomonas bacterium]